MKRLDVQFDLWFTGRPHAARRRLVENLILQFDRRPCVRTRTRMVMVHRGQRQGEMLVPLGELIRPYSNWTRRSVQRPAVRDAAYDASRTLDCLLPALCFSTLCWTVLLLEEPFHTNTGLNV